MVENRGGAGGIVGTEAVARARPDGTLVLLGSTGPLSLFPVAMAALPYDPLRDLAPIGIAYRVPIVLMVGRQVPARTLAEFVALAKATAGRAVGRHRRHRLRRASGDRDVQRRHRRRHRACALSRHRPGADDLIAGTIPVVFDQLSSALPLHADGRARILGIASAARSPLLPGCADAARGRDRGAGAQHHARPARARRHAGADHRQAGATRWSPPWPMPRCASGCSASAPRSRPPRRSPRRATPR